LAYRLKIFRGADGLSRISADWSKLASGMSSPRFLHLPQWYEVYCASLEPSPDHMVFCVFYADSDEPDRGAPVALLPLREEHRTVAGARIRTLELPRHDHLHLRDILISDSARTKLSLAEIVAQLRQCRDLRWDVLALWHALEDSCTMAAYRLAPPGLTICRQRFHCSHMPLGSWEEMSKRLSKSFRQNLRTANNRCKNFEGLKFETIRTLPDLDGALSAFLDVESSGWKGAGGSNSAIKLDARLIDFYRGIARRFGEQGQCEIHLLRHGGRPIGAMLLLLAGDTIYLPKCAYDEEYSRISPVHLLLERMFKQIHPERAEQIKHFNLVSDSSWFDVWQPRRMDVYNVYVFNTTMMGLAADAAMGLVDGWKRRRDRRAAAAAKA
jgi:CelD/BcsL family acetyltransferase involved in cellulose biosynthesis